MKPITHLREKYLRCLPTSFCAGCGNGIILQAFIRAIDNLQIPLTKILAVSGIGCSSWIPSPFLKSDVLHTTHGRAIAFATGARLANPELCICVFTGDGDCVGIGGNHFLHACRRDLDMLTLCVNNFLYGMTGGQVAPTTPLNAFTSTTPTGNKEKPVDLCALASVAGASYVARWTTYHIKGLIRSIENGIRSKGFAFIEIVSQCPTYYGRKNEFKDASEQMLWFKRKFGRKKKGVYKLGELRLG